MRKNNFKLQLILLRKIFLVAIPAFLFSCNQKTETIADNDLPEDNRFTRVTLTEGLDEPMEMSFLNDGHVLIIERKGGVKSFNTKTNQIKLIATIPVNGYCRSSEI
jgi:cytochrome c